MHNADIDIDDMLDFARAYASLGSAVQEQLEDLLNNPGEDCDCNPNAVRLIERTLGGYHPIIADACKEFFKARR